MLISNESLVLGQWHSVTATRTGAQGILSVDNQSPVTGQSPPPLVGTTVLMEICGSVDTICL